MANKKLIVEEIERLIDHYTPYRSATDSIEDIKVRSVLVGLLHFVNGGKHE